MHRRYHRPEFIGRDPLRWARAYDEPADREIAAFLASSLAYGNVVQIDRSLADLFKRIGRSPAAFARNFVPGKSDAALDGFYHRFNTALDLCALLHLLGQMLREHGSIQGFWAAANSIPAEDKFADIAVRAGRFIDRALALDFDRYAAHVGSPPKLPFLYLMPSAAGTSACKRFNLFLRWVVRPDDGIDLGLWTFEHSRDLQYPVDTHILRLSKYLGATRRKDAGAQTRREITNYFRHIDPDDPVRFDFALCRLGILRHCPTRQNLEHCTPCDLKPECLRHQRLARAAAFARAGG